MPHATLTLLLLTTIAAAPAPRYRPRPPAQVTPGDYTMTWSYVSCRVTLDAGRGYRAAWCGRDWSGSWHWDAATRTLHVRETADGEQWGEWSVRLDGSLAGEAVYSSRAGGAAVSLKPLKGSR